MTSVSWAPSSSARRRCGCSAPHRSRDRSTVSSIAPPTEESPSPSLRYDSTYFFSSTVQMIHRLHTLIVVAYQLLVLGLGHERGRHRWIRRLLQLLWLGLQRRCLQVNNRVRSATLNLQIQLRDSIPIQNIVT